jgi:hypothetical protein
VAYQFVSTNKMSNKALIQDVNFQSNEINSIVLYLIISQQTYILLKHDWKKK